MSTLYPASVAVQSLRLPAILVDRLVVHGISSAQIALERGEVQILEHCKYVGVPKPDWPHVWAEIKQAATKTVEVDKNRKSALDLLNEQQSAVPVRSFSRNLDNLLEGGIFTNSGIYEFAGGPGSGKTQVCMQLCATVQIPVELGGPGGGALFLDTEGSFTGERFREIASATADHLQNIAHHKRDMKRQRISMESTTPISMSQVTDIPTPSVDDMMNGVYVFRLFDVHEQLAVIMKLPQLLEQAKAKGTPIKLIVVDSMAFLFRHGFSKDDMQLRTKWLLTLSQQLTSMATQFDLAIVVTNHMTTRMNERGSMGGGGGSRMIPALGDSWSHQPNWRIEFEQCEFEGIEKEQGVGVKATILKCPSKAPDSAHFLIQTDGIRDPQQLSQQF